jgi:hypothetical protein
MGSTRKNRNRYQGLRKYNRIVSFLVKDRKKKNIPYNLTEIRQLASSIYPNFKATQYSKINKKSVVFGKPSTKKIISIPSEKKPTFPSELSDPSERYYWGLFDMLLLIQNATLKEDNLFFESEIAGQEDLEIQGGVPIEPSPQEFYKKYFKNFVNFLDLKKKEDLIDLGSGSDLRIIATEPTKFKDKWVSLIQITDANGSSDLPDEIEAVLLQYNPSEIYQGGSKPTAEKKSKEVQNISGSEQIEIEKIKAQERYAIEKLKSEERIATETEKTKRDRNAKIAKLYEKALKGDIDWDRYDKLVDDLFRDK